jgi:hypothetical protein
MAEGSSASWLESRERWVSCFSCPMLSGKYVNAFRSSSAAPRKSTTTEQPIGTSLFIFIFMNFALMVIK